MRPSPVSAALPPASTSASCVAHDARSGATSVIHTDMHALSLQEAPFDILVTTPSRLRRLLHEKHVSLGGLRCARVPAAAADAVFCCYLIARGMASSLVLDEVDTLLDDSFFEDTKAAIVAASQLKAQLVAAGATVTPVREAACGPVVVP